MKTLPVAIDSLKESLPGPISPYDQFMLRKALWFLLPHTEGLQRRYGDAVSAVAGEFPMLAFGQRSNDAIGPIIGRLRGTLPVEPKDAQFRLKIEDEVVQLSNLKLDELILELAKLHRRSIARNVEAMLKKPFQKPEEFIKFFADNLAAAIAEAHPFAEVDFAAWQHPLATHLPICECKSGTSVACKDVTMTSEDTGQPVKPAEHNERPDWIYIGSLRSDRYLAARHSLYCLD